MAGCEHLIRPVDGGPAHTCGRPVVDDDQVLCRQHARQSKARVRRRKPTPRRLALVIPRPIPEPGTQRSTRRQRAAEPPELKWFRQAVRKRAHGRCEAEVDMVCTHRYHHAHHVVPRGLGQGWELLHDPEVNGLGVCWECHNWIHGHPREAALLGLIRNSWETSSLSKAKDG